MERVVDIYESLMSPEMYTQTCRRVECDKHQTKEQTTSGLKHEAKDRVTESAFPLLPITDT